MIYIELMMDVNSAQFKKKCRFQLSLRYELFLAIGVIAAEDADIQIEWQSQNRKKMSNKLSENLRLLGASTDLWTVFSTILPAHKTNPRIEEIVEDLSTINLSDFQTQILKGLIHDESLSKKVGLRKIALKEAINAAPAAKREWLSYIDLYPYDKDEKVILALELLVSHPDIFRRLIIESIQLFWEEIFQSTWSSLEVAFTLSLEKAEKNFTELSFEEFADRKLLKITFSKDLKEMIALRGGYRQPIEAIDTCMFIPSIFNERRHWSSLLSMKGKTFVYFPYFDPNISFGIDSTNKNPRVLSNDLDPALIFKALGDSTRYGIVALLKEKSKTASEIADDLGLSKATISHHLVVLREAGIIQTDLVGIRNALLKINEDVIGSISEIYLRFLNLKSKRRKME